MPVRVEPESLPFDAGPLAASSDPELVRLAQELRTNMDVTSLASDVKPAAEGYQLGDPERPWGQLNVRNSYLQGTTTMSGSYQHLMRGTVQEFATNTTLIVLPIYTDGASPFDNWHPASPFFRDGAFWLTIGSPKVMHCRMGGVDRVIAVFDTATSTYAGTALLQRGQVTGEQTDYAVQFSQEQFPTDWDKLGLDIRGTSTFSTISLSGGISGMSLPDLDDVGALAYTAGRYLRADGDSYEEAQIDAGDIATGQLAHERGGLEADVSAYSGFIRINAGVTTNVGETGTGGVVRAASPTISQPNISNFTSAGHNHQNAAGGGTLDHGLALSGLGDDDHTQYLLVSGARAMSGNLDMDGNTVINAALHTDSDARKVMFGASDDASIYYDGNDMIFDSREVGTGDFLFKNGFAGFGADATAGPQELVHIGDGQGSAVLPVTDLIVTRESSNVCLAVRRNVIEGGEEGSEVAVWTGSSSSWIGTTESHKLEFGASNGVHLRIDTGGKVTVLVGPLDLNNKNIDNIGTVDMDKAVIEERSSGYSAANREFWFEDNSGTVTLHYKTAGGTEKSVELT